MKACNSLIDSEICGKQAIQEGQRVKPIYSQTSIYPLEYVVSDIVQLRCEEHAV